MQIGLNKAVAQECFQLLILKIRVVLVVGPGVEIPDALGSTGQFGFIDISDTNILVDFTASTSWNTAEFNGFVISDVFSTIDDFQSVTIDGITK